jgi:hypothetical protein
MRKRKLLTGICSLVLAGWFNLVSAAEGLILGFNAGSEVSLTTVTSTDRVPSPRSIPGPTWTLAATGDNGHQRWTRALAAPRQFHGDPDSAVSFFAIVPGVLIGDRLSMSDAQGFLLWTRIVDDALLVGADNNMRKLQKSLGAAYTATAKLKHIDSSDLSAVRGPDSVAINDQDIPHLARRGLYPTVSAKATQGTTLFHVGGTVVANVVNVRVFDATTNALVVSEQTDWTNSRFDFDLPRGRYVLEVDDNRLLIDSPFFFRKPFRTAPIQVASNLELPVLPQNMESGYFVLSAQVPCSLLHPTSAYSGIPVYRPTASVVADDGTRIQRINDRIVVTPPDSNAGTGQCLVHYSLQLSPGIYTVDFSIPGWESLHFDALRVDDGQSVQREAALSLADRTLVWAGTSVDSSNQPVVAIIWAIDKLDELTPIDLTEDSGHFEIPYSRDWTMEFEPIPYANREPVTRTRHFVGAGTLPSKVVAEDVATVDEMDSGLLRILGDGIREKHFNILFLADGYTDVHETFTDTNGNGVWDGIVWYDMNGDGQYDGAHDRFTRYGNSFGSVPVPDPSVNNEPFDDINNDGMLNVNDPAQFELNARDFMRSFLGSDFWSDHKQAFNAYLLFEPSEQAGSDVYTESGQLVVERSTRYNANLVQPRLTMSVDREAAMDRALAVLPELDMVVVLVNQTVVTLARGNVTFAQPGIMVWPSGLSGRRVSDMGPAHEMGHFVATLCDEYSEYPGVSPSHGNPSTGCPNTSYLNDPTRVPWSNWILQGASSPSRNMDGSIGIYEGAQYYEGGAYRPTFNSTMRYLSPLFNAPSRAALETAVHARTGEWRDEADDSGRCERLPLNAIHRHGATCH